MTFIQHIQKLQGTGSEFKKTHLKYCSTKIEREKFKVFVRRDKKICKVCKGAAHNIHHILEKRNYPHWNLEHENMISLCKPCHDKADKGLIETQTLFNLI